MNRQEFIEKLRAALSGRLPQTVVADNVNYYEDYINVEIRKGRTEEEVLQSLGDPRLIAKTIIQAHGGVNGVPNNGGQNAEYQDGAKHSSYANDYANSSYNANNGYANGNYYANNNYDAGDSPHIFRIPGWLVTVLTIVVVLFIISTIVSVLSFLTPLILVMVAVIFIVKLFRDWLN